MTLLFLPPISSQMIIRMVTFPSDVMPGKYLYFPTYTSYGNSSIMNLYGCLTDGF